MKTKTSHPDLTPSGVLGTMAKLIRLIDVEWSHWQHPTNNVTARLNLAEYLRMGCPKVSDNGEVVTNQLPKGHELACLILGDDYITPEEVATAYGFSYTDDQLEHFLDTLPDTNTILWFRANNYMLVAGPPMEMNLLQVRELDNKLFLKTEGWYAEDNQNFSREDKVSAQWLAIRKGEVPNSLKRSLEEQQGLITGVEYVPNAPEVSYAVTAFYKVRGIYLLHGRYVRTSSVSENGYHVDLGNFDKDGLDVNCHWVGVRSVNLGLSSALKKWTLDA